MDREHKAAERKRRYAYKQLKHTHLRRSWNQPLRLGERNEISSQYLDLYEVEFGSFFR